MVEGSLGESLAGRGNDQGIGESWWELMGGKSLRRMWFCIYTLRFDLVGRPRTSCFVTNGNMVPSFTCLF